MKIEKPWEEFYCGECIHCVQDDMCSAYIFGMSYAYCPHIRNCEKFEEFEEKKVNNTVY